MTKAIQSNVIIPAAPRDKSEQQVHIKKQKGIPLPEGYNLQDLSTAQRSEIMSNFLNNWKRTYNSKKSTINSITRG